MVAPELIVANQIINFQPPNRLLRALIGQPEATAPRSPPRASEVFPPLFWFVDVDVIIEDGEPVISTNEDVDGGVDDDELDK